MGAFGDIPPGKIVIPKGDLTTAAIEAVNLVLSELHISPLDLLLGALSGRPKNLDTLNVIQAYNKSAYWPLHALATNLSIALKNDAPISDSRPQIQAEFGTWKQGTIRSIQGFANVLQGPNGPGYWTLASLINHSWDASGDGVDAVLQYVKAIDALTVVLSQINQTQPQPPVPIPLPPPAPPPPVMPPVAPPDGAGDDDELAQWARKIDYDLSLLVGGIPTSGQTQSECCTNIVNAITLVVNNLTEIATAISSVTLPAPPAAPPPIDLNAIVSALKQIGDDLKLLAAAPILDVGPIAISIQNAIDAIDRFEQCVCDQLKRIADMMAKDRAIQHAAIQNLADRGFGDPQLNQILLS